jgi:hypothetical protein
MIEASRWNRRAISFTLALPIHAPSTPMLLAASPIFVAGPAELRNFPGFDQQMDMIAHQNISINVKPVAPPVFLHALQIVLSICIAAKDDLALFRHVRFASSIPAPFTM